MVVVREEEAELLSTFEYIEDIIEPPYELDVLKETPTR
jgi:methionyl aminopeptidase